MAKRRRKGRRAGKTQLRVVTARCDTTSCLTTAAIGWLVKRGFSCVREIAVGNKVNQRADVVGMNLRGDLVICEVKSGHADFLADKKWQTYLPHCNRLYFAISDDYYQSPAGKKMVKAVKEHGVGVMVLCPTEGYMFVKSYAEHRPMKGEQKRELIIRMAWRNGEYSARNSFRSRVYIGKQG